MPLHWIQTHTGGIQDVHCGRTNSINVSQPQTHTHSISLPGQMNLKVTKVIKGQWHSVEVIRLQNSGVLFSQEGGCCGGRGRENGCCMASGNRAEKSLEEDVSVSLSDVKTDRRSASLMFLTVNYVFWCRRPRPFSTQLSLHRLTPRRRSSSPLSSW